MIEDMDIKLLLKFVDPQYSESTLQGQFYFSRNRYFIELEENQIDKGIGDRREGVWSKVLNPKNEEMFIITEDGTQIPLKFNKAVFRQTYDDLKDMPICCFVLLSIKEDFEFEEGRNEITLKPDIEKKLIEQFKGRDLIIFSKAEEFIKRFDAALKEQNHNRMRGIVKYYDDEIETHPISQEEFDKDPAKTLLYKRKFFEFQKEFRIVIKKPHDSDILINIGHIKDIAYNLGQVETDKLPLNLKLRVNK